MKFVYTVEMMIQTVTLGRCSSINVCTVTAILTVHTAITFCQMLNDKLDDNPEMKIIDNESVFFCGSIVGPTFNILLNFRVDVQSAFVFKYFLRAHSMSGRINSAIFL